MQKLKAFLSSIAVLAMLFSNVLPVFALGEIPAPIIATPPPVEITPIPVQTPTPPPIETPPIVITPPADTNAPVISNITSLSLGTTEATLVWTTDELAVSHLEYGTTTRYGTQPTLSASALIAHTAILTGLAANTTYYYCIHATDLFGNTANSCGHSFTTAANPILIDSTPPNITLVTVAPITTTSATIGFTTNEIANAEVEYGTTAGYGNITPLDTNLALTHSVVISNLEPNTLYHYRIKTSDEIGNQTVGQDETFTTEVTSGGNIQISDTTPPVVSEVGSISFGTTTATLGWTTNELATSTLEYGITQSYGTHATLSLSALLAHTATLTGLQSGTTYYYCIHATDVAGNTTHSCGHSFTTESVSAPADSTPPVISLITAAPITNSAATITWTTSEPSNAQINYGTSANYGLASDVDPILSPTHSLTLTSLLANTTYHYQVKSVDDSGNTAVSSDQTFTTEPLPQHPTTLLPPNPPVIISGVETSSITTNSVTISWVSAVPSDSQVAYGIDENLGSLTVLDPAFVTNHSVTITGLFENTNYIFKMISKPASGSIATSSDNYEFNTLAQETPVVAPANILSVSSSAITTAGATISWTTDKNATSQVEYGISTSYGQSSLPNQAMQTSHQISLTDLAPGTTYHYRVKSTDEVSNITYSEDYSFATTAPAQTINAPPAITMLSIGAYDASSVALVWSAESPQADVAATYDIRYYTIPINESNFTSAIPAQTTSIRYTDLNPSGTQREFIIAGLETDTLYYFAIKSHFQSSEYSPISNVVSARTTKGASVSNESSAPVFSPGADSSEGNTSIGNNHGSGGAGEGSTSGGGGGGGGGGWAHVNQEYGTFSGGTSSGSFEPTLVKAEPADNQIIFSWHNPGEANFVRTVVVRKEGSYPISPADGQIIYEGRAQTFTDTNVQNKTTYYYAIYSYNHAKIYSSGVNISLAPSTTNKEEKFNTSGTETSMLATDHFTKVYKKGDKDIEIEHLQEILSADGDSYAQKYISGYFGALTQAALKKFQTKHGLPQTGVTDVATQKELNVIAKSQTRLTVPQDYSVFSTNMKLGDQNPAVSALQHYLIYEGSLSNNSDNGFFGASTKTAVATFQKKYGISSVSGYVGYKTRHKMKQLAGL